MLSANRLIFDGGQLDAQTSRKVIIEILELLLVAKKMAAMDLAATWIELDQYETLSKEIEADCQF